MSGCPADQTECDRACVDVMSDPNHCGTCNTACVGEACVDGMCVDTGGCNVPFTDCSGACVNTMSDEAHCGACGTACAATESCMSGVCMEDEPIDPPTSVCDNAPIAAEDTSSPDHVVGDGSPASCTHDALAAAVAEGGVITFDCGDGPAIIDVTSALTLRTDVDTIIDGAGMITLDGGRTNGRTNRIFEFQSDNYRVNMTRVVLQGLTLQNAQAPTEDFTPQDMNNPECAWGYKDGEGGALRMRDGRLHVIDCVFRNNYAAAQGPDTGGGAIYALRALEVIVVRSTFFGSECCNGGAIGLLQADGVFFVSGFEGNRATGVGQNFGGASGSPEFNHAAQGGAGGNS